MTDRGWMPGPACLLVTGGMLALAAVPASINAQEKPKAKTEKKPRPSQKKKPRRRPPRPRREESRGQDQSRSQDREEGRGQAEDRSQPPAAPPPNPNDPAKLKDQITALEKEVATLKLKVVTLELEKLGAMVTVDKAKDGKETATVNILKKWSGDKDALQLLKNVPNLQVVYIDNGQVNDAAVAPLKELTA